LAFKSFQLRIPFSLYWVGLGNSMSSFAW